MRGIPQGQMQVPQELSGRSAGRIHPQVMMTKTTTREGKGLHKTCRSPAMSLGPVLQLSGVCAQ